MKPKHVKEKFIQNYFKIINGDEWEVYFDAKNYDEVVSVMRSLY